MSANDDRSCLIAWVITVVVSVSMLRHDVKITLLCMHSVLNCVSLRS